MTRSLITRCDVCGKVTQLFDLRRCESGVLGDAIKNAALHGLTLEFTDGPIEPGCDCPVGDKILSEDGASGSGQVYRFNLMQLMLVITVVAVVLAIFRHPISLLFDEVVMKWAAVPWTIYGWFFFGTEIINPKTLAKNPMGIIIFLANVIVAVLLPMVVLSFAISTVKHLWQMAGNVGRKTGPEKPVARNTTEATKPEKSAIHKRQE